MTSTRESLTAKLAALQAEHDAIYRELLPSAITGSDRVVRWRDSDVARWLGTTADCVRGNIVNHLSGFSVDDTCSVALLTTADILLLLEFNAPRVFAIRYVSNEIAAVASYLSELGL